MDDVPTPVFRRNIGREEAESSTVARDPSVRQSFDPAQYARTRVSPSMPLKITARDESIDSFYHKVLRLLSETVKDLRRAGIVSNWILSLADSCLSLLYLWANGIDFQVLEHGVDKSTGLQESVAELLADIASDLTSGISRTRRSIHSVEVDIPAFVARYVSPDDDTWNEIAPKASNYTSVDYHTNTERTINQYRAISKSTDSKPVMSTDEAEGKTEAESLRVASKQIHEIRFEKIHESIKALMNLLPTIDNCCNEELNEPLPIDNIGKANEQPKSLMDGGPFLSQILDKFPSIPKNLATRLARANWERFFRLQTLRDTSLKAETLEREQAITIECPLQSIFQLSSEFQGSGLGSSLPVPHKYAPPDVSHALLLSTQSAKHRGSYRVPDTPEQVHAGIPFECEICGSMLDAIQSRSDWKFHVFNDLQPYVCTFDKCEKDTVTFSTRESWNRHELLAHFEASTWQCEDCDGTYQTADLLNRHAKIDHGWDFADDVPYQRRIVKLCEAEFASRGQNWKCPCCLRSKFANRTDFTGHVCRHMEEIALTVLPSNADYDTEDDDSDSREENVHSDMRIHPLNAESLPVDHQRQSHSVSKSTLGADLLRTGVKGKPISANPWAQLGDEPDTEPYSARSGHQHADDPSPREKQTDLDMTRALETEYITTDVVLAEAEGAIGYINVDIEFYSGGHLSSHKTGGWNLRKRYFRTGVRWVDSTGEPLHGVKPDGSCFCGRRYPGADPNKRLSEHIQKARNLRAYTCEHCTSRFAREQLFFDHCFRCHPVSLPCRSNSTPIECHFCVKTFMTAGRCEEHMIEQHRLRIAHTASQPARKTFTASSSRVGM